MKLRRVLEAKARHEVWTIPMDGNVSDFIRTAVRRGVGALIVVDDKGKPAGILSERDIVRHCERKTDFDHTPVGLIMTRDIVTGNMDDDIAVGMGLMIKHRIRHLAVLEGDRIAGIATLRDIICAMRDATEEELHQIMAFLKNQPDVSWKPTLH
ncbi:MAG: CBS domain-containing protein [bacterium]